MTRSQATPRAPRRALVFAGGGVKVAYQAGAVQVLLDEAGIEFDLADGASGGVFNLAMWCQGMTGRQIADNWRNYQPLGDFSPNLGAWLRGPWGASVLTAGGLRRHTLTGFGLDWHAIRSTSREAVFELFNVSRQELQPVPAAQITEDRLLSAVALPMWFPPVRIDGDTYIDAVFGTDGNLEEMIRRGADELWVIWTVSTRGRWAPGFVAEYFLMIEAAANSGLRAGAAADRAEQRGHRGRPPGSLRPPDHRAPDQRRSSPRLPAQLPPEQLCARRGPGGPRHPGLVRPARHPDPAGPARPDPGGTVSAGTAPGTSSRGTTVPLPRLTVPGPAGAPPRSASMR